jgi:hypothetical protein
MRGEDRQSGGLFSYVDRKARVPAAHPLRPIRRIVDDALSGLSGEFESSWTTICCTAGSWVSGSTIRCGIRQHSRPTASACSRARWRGASWPPSWTGRGQAAALGRALLGRRHAGGGVGEPDELPAEGWSRRRAAGRQRRAGLPRRAASQREPFALRADTTSALGASEARTDPQARLFRKGTGKEARRSFMGHCPVGLGSGAPTPL